MYGLEVEIREGCTLAAHGVGIRLLADDERGTSPTVTRTDDAILGEDSHGAGTLDVVEYVLDALAEGFALNDEQSHQLGGVGTA